MEIVSVQPIPPRKPGANYRFAVVVKDGDEHLSVVMTPRGVRSRNVFERDFLGQTGRVFRWSGDVRVLLTGHESPADRETLAQVYGPDQMMLERDYVSPTEQMERLLTAHHAAKVLPPMRANEVLIGMDAQAKQAATINATGAAVK